MKPFAKRVLSLRAFPGPLVLVGAGKMGGAMLDGWLARGLTPSKIVVLEPQPVKADQGAGAGAALSSIRKASRRRSRRMVIAVKPQTAPDAVPPLARLSSARARWSSRSWPAARSRFLEERLPAARDRARHAEHAGRDRPRHHGRGRQCARVSAAQRKLATRLLAAIGAVEWVDDEALMDAVTAVSGSGPAYVFLLAEAMAQAGVAAGLPADLADKLARETVAGSGELLHRSTLDAATLRQNVTSPGGTTAAALDVLMARGRPRRR